MTLPELVQRPVIGLVPAGQEPESQVFAEARKNLKTPVTIYTQIAIEQIDSNRDLPSARSRKEPLQTSKAICFPFLFDRSDLHERPDIDPRFRAYG